jgi:hypothetical protein
LNHLVLLRVKEERNVLHPMKRRKSNCTDHIVHRNCRLKHIIEGKIEEGIKVTGRQGKRRKQLLDDLKGTIGYSKFKEEAADCTLWRTHFDKGYMDLLQDRLQNDENVEIEKFLPYQI